MRAGVPGSAADLTAEWLSAVMAPHSGGARLLGCDRTAVGTGQVAATYRIATHWDRPTTAPSSLVVKVTSDDATSREAARSTRTYEIEACFYNELAGSLAVRAPRCFHAAHEVGGDGYVVVLEDLAPARQGDQIAGCTTDEAAAAIDELPQLHAPRWGDPALAELPWLDRVTPEALQFTALVLGSCATGFLERYASSIDDDILALVDRLIPRLEAYLAPRPRPWTVAHGDFRLDNLLFGSERVAVVDWQTVVHGPGVGDLSYFLGSATSPERRRAHERELVDYYRAGMAAHHVTLDPDELWNDYRRAAFSGLLMAIGASMLVGRTERGDQMFITMAQRHGRHALDLDAEDLI